LNTSIYQHQHTSIIMPRLHEVQSGLDDGADASDAVDYESGEDLRELSGNESDDSGVEQHPPQRDRKGKAAASSSSQQVNAVKQSALNAQAAASAAASHELSSSSSSAENDKARDLQLKTLIMRCERKLKDLSKRERELEERERASTSKSSKRRKSSSSNKHSSDVSECSDGEISSVGGDESDSSDGGTRDRSSSRDSEGKDITLRQNAIRKKLDKLKYVDIAVFTIENLNVRKAEKLTPITSYADFIAAWASFNVELQQCLINADRGADALMVSKYYSQIMRLLTDYSGQWQLVMELDVYIRGATLAVNEPIVWSIDRDDDHVSRFRFDIRFNNQVSTPPHPAQPTQRGAHSTARRNSSSGSHASNRGTSKKSPNVCYAYNGWNSTTNEWNSTSHCWNSTGAAGCKYTHKCYHCKAEGHAVYERAECAAQPRAAPATSLARQPRRG
jgi:hypothetical protein